MSSSRRIACFALLLGACVSSDFEDGQFRCDPADPAGCPDGMTCASDGTCRHGGSGAGGSGVVGGGGSGGGGVAGSGGVAGGSASGGAGGSGGAVCNPTDVGGASTVKFGERPDATEQDVTADANVTQSNPENNYGENEILWVDGDNILTSLLRFDLCSVPAGTVVTAASLDLYVFNSGSSDGPGTTVTAHELLEAWVEGDQYADLGVANYTERLPGELWTTPGARLGSHAADPLFSFSNATLSQNLVYPLPIELVQRWIDDPTTNHGIALVTNDADGVGITSSEASGEITPGVNHRQRRPLLQLELSDGT